jgi:hypothetical protein
MVANFVAFLTTDALREQSYENPTEINLMLRGYGFCLWWPVLERLPSCPVEQSGYVGLTEPGCEQEGSHRQREPYANGQSKEIVSGFQETRQVPMDLPRFPTARLVRCRPRRANAFSL